MESSNKTATKYSTPHTLGSSNTCWRYKYEPEISDIDGESNELLDFPLEYNLRLQAVWLAEAIPPTL